MIVSHVKLSVSLPEGAPERVTERWAETLKENANHILEGFRERFPDDVRFQSGLVEPAHKKFRGFVNPSFVSRAGVTGQGIINHHLNKMMGAFKKFRDGIEAIFANDGQLFKARVDAAKQYFSEGIAQGALLFTGSKREERGPAPIATLWLTNDPITLGLMRAGDTILEGGPYLVCPETKKPGLKAMLNQRLIQAGVEILKSAMDATVIATQNQLTCEQIQGFTDPSLDLIPFVAAGDSHVDYIVEDGNLYLDIKVSKM